MNPRTMLPVFLVAMLASPLVAFAQSNACDPGGLELSAILKLFASPLGIGIGLLVVVWGLYEWFVTQNTKRGIMLCVCGVMLTALPQFFYGTMVNFYPAAQQLGADGAPVSNFGNIFNRQGAGC